MTKHSVWKCFETWQKKWSCFRYEVNWANFELRNAWNLVFAVSVFPYFSRDLLPDQTGESSQREQFRFRNLSGKKSRPFFSLSLQKFVVCYRAKNLHLSSRDHGSNHDELGRKKATSWSGERERTIFVTRLPNHKHHFTKASLWNNGTNERVLFCQLRPWPIFCSRSFLENYKHFATCCHFSDRSLSFLFVFAHSFSNFIGDYKPGRTSSSQIRFAKVFFASLSRSRERKKTFRGRSVNNFRIPL